MTPAVEPYVEVTTVDQVTIVRFPREIILSGVEAETVSEQLKALLADPPGRKLLIDFANVVSLSSLILGKLVSLNRVASLGAGKLALCRLRPEIREIMDITRLSLILTIYAEEQEALRNL